MISTLSEDLVVRSINEGESQFKIKEEHIVCKSPW